MSFRLTGLVLVLMACGDKEVDAVADADTDTDTDADTDTDTDVIPDPQATLTAGGAAPCTAVGRVGNAWYERRSVPSAPDSDALLPLEPWVWGSGVVAADFDDDGLIDVFTANEVYPSFFRNTGVGLDDVGPAVCAGLDLELTTGGSAADYDGDGDLDLLITRYQRPNLLLKNLGGGQFDDATAASGIPTEARRSMGSTWADYDGDGDLDLYIGNYGFVDETIPSDQFLPGEDDWLLVNDGDGTFTDRSDTIPQNAHEGFAYAVAWMDFDDNGFPELYIVNDFGISYPNTLLWNSGGVLTADDGSAGLNGAWTGMGLDFADINHDGVADVFLPIWNGLVLAESLSTPSGPLWVESAGVRTLRNDLLGRDQKVAWGGDFGDVDNDGDEDLLVQYGWVTVGTGAEWENPLRQPDGLYLMQADGSFDDQGAAIGVDDDGIGRGGVLADFNNDGFLDIVKRDVGGASIAYLSMCDTNAWLRIRPTAPWSANQRAIGAKVRVTAGGQVQTNWIRAGGLALASAGPPEAHFGFGQLDLVDRVEILWPDGRTSIFVDVPTRQVLDIAQHAPTL